MSAYIAILFTVPGRFSHIPGLKHVIGASFFTSFHPSPEFASGQFSIFSLYSLLDIPLWTVAILGVPTFMMGYGFPQLIRAGTHSSSAVGRSIARVYFANIVGSTLGSLLVGFVLLENLGTERTLVVLISLGALVGLAARIRGQREMPRSGRTTLYSGTAVAALVVGTLLVFPRCSQIIKAIHFADFSSVQFVSREDRTGVVALRTQHSVLAFAQESHVVGLPRLYIDGAAHGRGDDGGEPDRAVGLALARAPAPRRILSIGLGDGMMCATAIPAPSVSELVIVELNAALVGLLGVTQRGKALTMSPRVRLVNDDGRRWLLANPNEKFDLIMMWPLHAAHAYYGNLFSKEFFELVSAHLTPSGVLVARSVDLFSTPRTLISVFDHVIRVDQYSYIGSRLPLRFDEQRLPFPSPGRRWRTELPVLATVRRSNWCAVFPRHAFTKTPSSAMQSKESV